MRTLALILVFLCLNSLAQAVVDPPHLFRVCLNRNDSMVTLEWTQPDDACNSFTEYHIYGRENSGAYSLLGTESNIANTIFQVKLSSAAPTWNFYIQTLHTCSGTDSVASNSLKVDNDAPPQQEIDSVSVDYATQKIVVGWQRNPATDTKWYRVYETENFSKRIGDTVDLTYMLKQHSALTPIKISLAAFDSCDLPAPLSDIHSHMILTQNVDTCSKSITLTWSAYEGWGFDQVNKYEIHVKKNGGPFVIDGTSNSISYVFRNFELGDQLCFFIRAHKKSVTRVTSSSNEVCLSTRKPVVPSVLYIDQVTVNGDEIDISWVVSGSNDISQIILRRDDGTGYNSTFVTNNTGTDYSYPDPNVQVASQSHLYSVDVYDLCNNPIASSNASRSIHLTLNKARLEWNSYIGWAGIVGSYDIEQFDGSTWSIIGNTSDLFYELDSSFFNSSVCLRVRANENNNPVLDQTSNSNQVCTEGRFSFYVPNAINPGNEENYFRVVGTNVDYSRSTAIIFNRWGQQLVQINDLKRGWDGMVDNEQLPLGVYYYSMKVFGLNNEREERSGFIRIIR